jgi:hypothetical protein
MLLARPSISNVTSANVNFSKLDWVGRVVWRSAEADNNASSVIYDVAPSGNEYALQKKAVR